MNEEKNIDKFHIFCEGLDQFFTAMMAWVPRGRVERNSN